MHQRSRFSIALQLVCICLPPPPPSSGRAVVGIRRAAHQRLAAHAAAATAWAPDMRMSSPDSSSRGGWLFGQRVDIRIAAVESTTIRRGDAASLSVMEQVIDDVGGGRFRVNEGLWWRK